MPEINLRLSYLLTDHDFTVLVAKALQPCYSSPSSSISNTTPLLQPAQRNTPCAAIPFFCAAICDRDGSSLTKPCPAHKHGASRQPTH
ncbi:hypothetical protein IF1G_08091 [Cordyceps javanica]|uniref:Uncharacterized protein n=1 Tax=Cordyceps javanica TaxID=43265 RepID=A0A545UVM2_9HYPO|nr:hypothetical protein IF1G_08091 [Cordyceps javanica]